MSNKTQRDRLLALFLSAPGHEVSLPEILRLNIAQYSARICELRRLGFHIENRAERRPDGVRMSWFKLVSSPPTASKPAPEPRPAPVAADSLFGDLRGHRDDG